ncbi:hypothetical protein PMAYCL1PPCAC_11595, partial [Pristionchus mayeri]
VPFLSMHENREFWAKIGATPFTLSVLESGYSLNFVRDPKGINIPVTDNRRGSIAHRDFVMKEVGNLLKTGAIELCSKPRVISPLSVAEGKKLRLILDLSALNVFLYKSRFRVEDLVSVWYSLPFNGFMATFDLRSGYHHVSIDPSSRPYFAFRWDGETYQYSAMPFGLSPAPWVFTKIFRTLVRAWREKGINVTLYLDDGLILAESREKLEVAVRVVRDDLEKAGVSTADEKCEWNPSQSGLVASALERLAHLREVESPTVRDRNCAIGSLMSMTLILGDTATLLSRSLLSTVGKAQQIGLPSSTPIPLSQAEKGEISQWISELKDRSVRSFVELPWHFDLKVETDASASGLGVVIKELDLVVNRASRNLTHSEREESSTLRELRAVDFAVYTFEREWKGKNILFLGDNQSAISILRKGSMKPELNEVASRIERAGARMNANFKFFWLPREMNEEADAASMIDMFADESNAKCKTFVSRSPSRGAAAIDAFSSPPLWRSTLLWCVPPPYLLCQTLAWLRGNRAKAILGLPYWTSHPIFPSLFPPNSTPPFVKDYLMFSEGMHVIIPGTITHGPFSRLFMDSPFTLLLIDF